MDSTTALIVIVVIFAIIVLAALLRYRRKGEASIEVGGAKVSVKGENEPQKPKQGQGSPSAGGAAPGASLEDGTSHKGGILIEDKTGKGAAGKRLEANDDIIVSSSPPAPKA